MKRLGMLIISHNAKNQGFCSHLGGLGLDAIIKLSKYFKGALKEITIEKHSYLISTSLLSPVY